MTNKQEKADYAAWFPKPGETKEQVNNSENEFDSKKLYFNPASPKNEGDAPIQSIIRILPPAPGEDLPYHVRKYHKIKTKCLDFKTKKIVEREVNANCLIQDCPICAYAKQLWDKTKELEKDDPKLKILQQEAGSYSQKTAYVYRVIDRAHEDDGVKFWMFDKTKKPGTFNKLCDLAADAFAWVNDCPVDYENSESIYNYLDIEKGFDVNIKKAWYSAPELSLGKQKPLTKDPELAEKWLSENRTISDILPNKKKHSEWLSFVLSGKPAFFDKNKNEWVEWIERNRQQNSESESEQTNSVSVNKTPPTPVFTQSEGSEGDEDLPF